jgi:hypothetical protein
VVAAARNLVTSIRASGQRREDFAIVIAKGNKAGIFGPEGLHEVVLLKDMDVRWSSTFLMIDRVLELYPVSCNHSFLLCFIIHLSQAIRIFLLKDKNASISHHALTDLQSKVLDEIQQFLALPHAVQELVSAEKTPTLPVVLPTYEKLLHLFKLMKPRLPNIDAAIEKLSAYFARTRKTRIYALALRLFICFHHDQPLFTFLLSHQSNNKA